MEPNSRELAPFFRDGLLFLPDKAIELLKSSGLNSTILEASRRGLRLEDGCDVAEISSAMEQLLENLSHNAAQTD